MSDANQKYVRIPLTQGKFAIIDRFNLEKINDGIWYFKKSRNGLGGYAEGWVSVNETSVCIKMHTFLMGGRRDGYEVDHIDGDGLNNTMGNLRHATQEQNSRNRRKSVKNSSGFKGVSLKKSSGKWCAQIRFKNKVSNLGYFDSPELAYKVYRAKELELFGEFASIEQQFKSCDDIPIAPRKDKKLPSTGIRGVWFRKPGMYIASAWSGGKSVHLGVFPTPELASAAVEAKIKELRPCSNFPDT